MIDYIAEDLRPLARPITELTLDPRNARLHPSENLADIKASLEAHGQVKAIVVRNGTVVAGNGTLTVAKALGWEYIACVEYKGTKNEARAFALADNRASDRAAYDEQILSSELEFLTDEGLLAATGYDDEAFKDIIAVAESEANKAGLHGDGGEHKDGPPADDMEVPEVKKEAQSKFGEVYRLGKHELWCADSREILKALTEEPALMLADPPYGIDVVGNDNQVGGACLAPIGKYERVHGDLEPFDPKPYLNCARSTVLFGANHYADKLPPSPGWIVWDKREGMPSNDFADCELAWTSVDKPARLFAHRWNGMIKASERTERRVHPTQKPVALMSWIIEQLTEHGDEVFDPFAGSGPVLLACEETGRRCICVEITPAYCDVIRRRWTQFCAARGADPGPGALS